MMTHTDVVERASQDGLLGRYFEVQLACMYAYLLRDGGVAIDGGANSGLHSIGMAHAIGDKRGHVYGFEPQADVFDQAVRWAKNEGYAGRISFSAVALGAEGGEVSFFRSSTHSAFSSLKKINLQETYAEFSVQVTTIDAYLSANEPSAENLKVVKLDLEGGEYHAILGARGSINAARPVVCFENAPVWAAQVFGYPSDGIPSLFEDLGYSVYDFFCERMTRERWKETKAFMFFAAPTGGAVETELLDVSNRFWTATAPNLDLAVWQGTVKRVLEAARNGQ